MKNMHKIIAVTPTRGDRPRLLDQCKYYIGRQTYPIYKHLIIDHPPKDNEKDITLRFREGITQAFSEGADLVIIAEDDDWYHPDYVGQMVNGWESAGNPSTFGISYTYYYHLGISSFMFMKHPERASAFSTMVTKDVLRMKWPADKDPFFDIVLWKQFKGKTMMPDKILSLGIKGYAVGALFGGMGHNSTWQAYRDKDADMSWLHNVVGEDFEFYRKLGYEIRNYV